MCLYFFKKKKKKRKKHYETSEIIIKKEKYSSKGIETDENNSFFRTIKDKNKKQRKERKTPITKIVTTKVFQDKKESENVKQEVSENNKNLFSKIKYKLKKEKPNIKITNQEKKIKRKINSPTFQYKDKSNEAKVKSEKEKTKEKIDTANTQIEEKTILPNKETKALEDLYKKYLIESIKDDNKIKKSIDEELDNIKKTEKELYKENELEKQITLVKKLEEEILNLKNKYYYIFLNDNKELYSFNKIDINTFLENKDNITLKEKIDDLRNEINKIEKKALLIDKDLKEKENEKVKKIKDIKNINYETNQYNKMIDFAEKAIAYQNNIYRQMEKKLGKINLKKYTTSIAYIDYNKLLSSTIMLSITPALIEKRKKFGLLLGTVLATRSISILYNFMYFKEVPHQKAKMTNYKSLINNSINQIDFVFKDLNIAMSRLETIKADFIKKYDKSLPGYNETIKKIDILLRDLKEKEIELSKQKENLKIAKEKNDKALVRKRKSEY